MDILEEIKTEGAKVYYRRPTWMCEETFVLRMNGLFVRYITKTEFLLIRDKYPKKVEE